MTRTIVTISRQLGSGGAFIGQQVASRLGIRYLDREILREAANVLQEDPAILERREERASSFMENFLRTLSMGTPDTGYIPPPYRLIYDGDIFDVEAEIIRKVARKESAVIVGRAGYHVLREQPGVLNVFLHAPREFRLKRVMEIYGISDSHRAGAMIEESDSNRKRFIEKITGKSWGDALDFHLAVDTGIAGFPLVVDTIASLVEKMVREAPRQAPRHSSS